MTFLPVVVDQYRPSIQLLLGVLRFHSGDSTVNTRTGESREVRYSLSTGWTWYVLL
jgi:hypothetical protein